MLSLCSMNIAKKNYWVTDISLHDNTHFVNNKSKNQSKEFLNYRLFLIIGNDLCDLLSDIRNLIYSFNEIFIY